MITKTTKKNGSAYMMHPLVRSVVTVDISTRRDQLRPDVEHDQHDQDPARGLVRQVRDEEELRLAAGPHGFGFGCPAG